MKRTILFLAAAAWLPLLDLSNMAPADEGTRSASVGGYELSWYTIDGGGGTSQGGGFTLLGSIGQPDAGDLAGGTFVLRGGFGQPAAPICPWDLTGDGVVNASDLALLLGAWGTTPGHPADFNNDGVVNASDLALLLGGWGACE